MFFAIATSSLGLSTRFNFFEVGALRFISEEQFIFYLKWFTYFNLYRYLHLLVNWKEIASLPSQQVVNLQNSVKTNLDTWNSALGMR
jgi:hypothetical protein